MLAESCSLPSVESCQLSQIWSSFEARKNSKKHVQQHLSKCRARVQRANIQKRDQSFHSKHSKHFQKKQQKKGGTSYSSPTSDPSVVLPHWAHHFSHCSTSPSLQKFLRSIPEIELQSHQDDDLIFDVPEEVGAAINRLKRGSSTGPDSLSPHHLVHAGPLIRSWLCKIFNAIVNLKAIPSPFKTGVVIPIYKGKGEVPLLPTSYRGITLTSVIMKTFEYSILDRMLPILRDRNLPQLTQTAYQHGVSCADAPFSCQETISKFIRVGDSVYSCFYDLASAFDTVEYPVLLSHLKNSGISGKA